MGKGFGFRYNKWLPVSYSLQGYIYFCGKNFHRLPEPMKKQIRKQARASGGQYHAALMDWLTSDKSDVEVCMRHSLSEKTLARIVRKFYIDFAKTL